MCPTLISFIKSDTKLACFPPALRNLPANNVPGRGLIGSCADGGSSGRLGANPGLLGNIGIFGGGGLKWCIVTLWWTKQFAFLCDAHTESKSTFDMHFTPVCSWKHSNYLVELALTKTTFGVSAEKRSPSGTAAASTLKAPFHKWWWSLNRIKSMRCFRLFDCGYAVTINMT